MTHGVGIIGAGIGAEHLAGYRRLPERFDVRWLCDLDLGRAGSVAGDVPVTADIADLLADPTCTLVDICLPPHLHLPVALQALAAGKHVICEKPLVTSLADADQLARAADRAQRRVFPVFQYRYGLGMAQLQAVQAAGLAGPGQVATLETHWDRDAAYYANDWRGTWAGERGGAVVTHAIHIHDLITCAFGPVACVQARLATRVNPIDTDDCAALILTMQSGALVTSSVTLGAAGNQSRLRLVFRDVTVESDLAPYAPAAAPWRFTARDPADQPALETVLADVAMVPPGFTGYLGAVADALDHGAPAVSIADARASLDLITGIYASARADGAAHVLPTPPDHPAYAGWQPTPDPGDQP